VTDLATFLEALKTADGETFVNPPGLGRGWRAKHVRAGLERHVLTANRYGDGLCYAQFPKSHGACQGCAQRRGAICTHCACAMCQFDRMTDEHGGPPVTRAHVESLRAQLRDFQIGRRAPVVALDAD
jgi:hypothetical protein